MLHSNVSIQRWLFLLLLSSFAAAAAYFASPSASPIKSGESVRFNEDSYKRVVDVSLNGEMWRVAWVEVEDPSRISLAANFNEKKSAETIFKTRECEALVNGGFYTPEDEPIGLFVADGEKIGEKINDAFFSGIFAITEQGSANIFTKLPDDSVRFALQSGPILFERGEARDLSVRDDKPARRVGVAIAAQNRVVFFVVYSPQSLGGGPYLADVPEILREFQKNSGVEIRDALNLDGGSASAFYTKNFSLSEAAYIGSYFCVR